MVYEGVLRKRYESLLEGWLTCCVVHGGNEEDKVKSATVIDGCLVIYKRRR